MGLFKAENTDQLLSSNKFLFEEMQRRVNLLRGRGMVMSSFQCCGFLQRFFNVSPIFGFQINYTFLKQVSPDIFSFSSY